MTRNFSHKKSLISNHKTHKRPRREHNPKGKKLKCKQTPCNKRRCINKVELEKGTGDRSCVLKLRAIPFISLFNKNRPLLFDINAMNKIHNPYFVCVVMERSRSVSDQSAVILWCDTSTAALGHWTERAKAVNQDWILSAASSKGAGLSFHISALRFDIYEHKLSANELALPSGPQTQHRQPHTHTHTHIHTG